MSFRVLVCGGRDYKDRDRIFAELDGILGESCEITLIHGGCPTGADVFAVDWAHERRISDEAYVANWKEFGKAAGPIRNHMIDDGKPDLVVAFPGGRGTQDMVRRAEVANIPVRLIT